MRAEVEHEKAQLKKFLKRQSALFYNISNLSEQRLSYDELLNEAADITRKHWIYPEGISVEIEFDDHIIQTADSKISGQHIETKAEVTNDLSCFLRIYNNSKRIYSDEEKELADIIIHNISAKLLRIHTQKEIEEKQKMLDKAYKLARIGTWEYDMINDDLYWSDVTKEVHGFGPDYEPDVESTIQLFKEGYHRNVFEKAATDAIENEKPFDVELKIISGKGDERWIRATGEPEYKNGECIRFYGISQNVTARRKAEEEIELNDRRFRAMMEHGMDMIAILDGEANYKFASPAALNVLGFPPEYFVDKNAFGFVHEDDENRLRTQFSKIQLKKSIQLMPFRFLDSDGQWRWLEATVTNLSDDPAVQGYVVNSRDVTERQIKQEEIIDSLKQKETLLAEIHHRIKNNLSVLTGLLQLQASGEKNEEVLARLFDSIARIQTMASIHEQLYQSNNFSSLEFAERIRLLALSIQKSYQSETEVEIDFQCESVELSVEKAFSVSLIVNEIMTNIFKHAFLDRDKGKISIRLNETDVSDYKKLTIEDNGIGLPEDFSPKESSSLGLTLIHMLSEQLPAQYFFEATGNGTTFTLLFKIE